MIGAMDYRLTDAAADPAGVTDQFNVERLIRLPQTAWCYQPKPDAPDVGELPALRNGFVTFASFNNLAKVTPQVLKLWADVVHAVPISRLLITAEGLDDPAARQNVHRMLIDFGVDASRLELLGRAPATLQHLDLYNRCDIALDTYPYNGTTTTCEALWMGVPVVTLRGPNLHMARVSASLLATVGLEQPIGDSPVQFVQRAATLAADVQSFAELRRTMRERLQTSPLLDANRFTGILAAAYRQMWREWCRNR
jgi:predicted O-linked N-acetylglucosamine transferase (SPINDLY family)